MKIAAYLFDWGDTLMKDDKRYAGPMQAWPEVAAVDGALETLQVLSTRARCCLATNAGDSSEKDIWRALARVGLDQYIDIVFCCQALGVAKPARAFFDIICKETQTAAGSDRHGRRFLCYGCQRRTASGFTRLLVQPA